MTARQKILKWIYPVFSSLKKISGQNNRVNHNHISPYVSLYGMTVLLNDGHHLDLATLKGKKILFVNTASDCGFTQQYAELQQLFEARQPGLEIIAFPSNDFKQQEKKNDEEIALFCRTNFGITFPLAAKSSVIRSELQHPVFEWLSNAQKNGWNNQAPSWNFSKYLVNEAGMLTHYFDPSVSPAEKMFTDALGK